MKRRNFLTAAGLLGTAPLTGAASLFAADRADRQLYELRKYRLLNFAKQERLSTFLEEAAIPAWNRIDIEPVGVFSVRYGPTEPTLYTLLPHPSAESFLMTDSRLAEDDQFQEEGAEFLEAPIDDPAFVRMESSLKLAFAGMPQLEVPEATANGEDRIFELRTYESHSPDAARRKIEMFNEGGEIEIFRKTGLTPVFFAESLIGPNLPNLTYMLTFDDMQDRNESWETFINDPDWEELSQDTYYADTVSNITDYILEPTSYSQI